MKHETPDLYLSAYVIACGTPLSTSRREGRRVWFGFELESLEAWEGFQRSFHSGEGQVSGKAMAEAVKAVKSLVSIT